MKTRTLAAGQGLFYVLTGLWPLFSIRSFEKVTGPKTDDWLVKTVGSLVAVTGVVLLRSAFAPRAPRGEMALLAAGNAFALGSISANYALQGRISKIYLLDTLVEYGLAATWMGPSLRRVQRHAA